jgi:putative hydrolase of the HAD superfamily
MSQIKNIIFDLGAVLFDIDFNKVSDSFKELGISNFHQQYSQLHASGLFQDLEKGKITPESFYQSIQYQVKEVRLTEAQIKKAWNSILIDFRIESMNYLSVLKENYSIYLLSNTNQIHIAEVNDIVRKKFNKEKLDDFFIKAYYSHIIGMRKPDEDIYRFILHDAGIRAEETLFIDDSPPNIEASLKLGIQSHLLLAHEKIENLIFY